MVEPVRASDDADEESLQEMLRALGFDDEASLRKLVRLNVYSIHSLAAQPEERLIMVSVLSLKSSQSAPAPCFHLRPSFPRVWLAGRFSCGACTEAAGDRKAPHRRGWKQIGDRLGDREQQ